jgi:metallo-beta-lactamase class B
MRLTSMVFAALAVIQGGGTGVFGQPPSTTIKQAAQSLIDAQLERSLKTMNGPCEPFHLIGNISYVGASDVTSFLITTPHGHILIDSGFEATVPMIRDNVKKLGHRFEDIKIVLNSHAHLDHAGGHALLKRLIHAQIAMSEADAALLARGGKGDYPPISERVMEYEPAQADRTIRDGDKVSLGATTLTAHLTPGHTKGCTTWTMIVEDGGKRYHVVFYGSTTILPGVRLSNNPNYPQIVDDFTKTFAALGALKCDVFLAPHGSMFGLRGKARRLAAGEKPNPFINPDGYRSFVARSERAFREQLAREPH